MVGVPSSLLPSRIQRGTGGYMGSYREYAIGPPPLPQEKNVGPPPEP